MELLWIVLAPFLLAAAAPLLTRAAPRGVGWILAVPAAIIVALLARHIPHITAGGSLLQQIPWVPGLDVALAFNLDGFSLLFSLLIAGIGTLILVYGGGYLAGDRDLGRFYVYLLMFMGSMLGVVLADDLLTLFVFWELTSITSFFLIGYYHEDAVSRRNAMQAMLVTVAGGLALLAGLILLGNAAGTMRITEILAMGDEIRQHPHYLAITLLVIAGAFTKSAQFPFHYWLPNAMAAPTPVSAYLHSATMVKAGVYLLARLNPALGGTELWLTLLTLIGGATMIVGAYLAFRHTDFKLVLAYTTVSALGTLIMLLGIGTPFAMKAFVVFLLAHALYKGAFFLIAGIVDHETGTRDITRLGGLRKSMPITTIAAAFAGLSLAGLPPFFAFIAKETLLEAALEAPPLGLYALILSIAAGILFVALAARIAYRPFFGPHHETPKDPHEAPPSLLLGPAVLTVIGLIFGLVPSTAQPLLTQAGFAVAGEAVPVSLALWHGINLPLMLSIGIVTLGLLLYFFRDRADAVARRFDPWARYGPERAYFLFINGCFRIANWQTRTLQNTHLRVYFIVLALAAVLGVGLTVLTQHGLPHIDTSGGILIHELLVAIMIAGGAILTAVARSRLGAIIAIGIVGYGIALLFILYGAPDLALTQFLFETLIVLLFTFVIIRMPAFVLRSTKTTKAFDAVIGGLVGLLATGLALIAIGFTFHEPISTYFAENSYLLAQGRNVVNVILVDFRTLDTLGEIIVIAVAAIGAYALLSMRQHKGGATEERPQEPHEESEVKSE
jgi:multicomponent Na+:H+ antiporter subunit A